MRAVAGDGDGTPLGPADDGAGDVEPGGELGLAGHDELGGELEAAAEVVGRALEAVDHLAVTAVWSGGELVVVLRRVASSAISTYRSRSRPTSISSSSPPRSVRGPGQADGGLGLVDGAVGLGPGVVLGHPTAEEQAGGAVVALVRCRASSSAADATGAAAPAVDCRSR